MGASNTEALAAPYSRASVLLRSALAFSGMLPLLLPHILLNVLLLPWRRLRVRLGNAVGRLAARWVLLCTGISYQIEGPAPSSHAPALYVMNHTGTIDFWLALSLCPAPGSGTVKRNLLKVPVVGIAYWLSGHLMLDHSRKERAVEAMQQMTDFVRDAGISIWILPEGTRSETGRLKPFKKGFAHIALGTRLPIVPVVVHDGHQFWGKGWPIRGGTVKIDVLEPISTESWTPDTLDEHIRSIEDVFASHLGAHQRPAER